MEEKEEEMEDAEKEAGSRCTRVHFRGGDACPVLRDVSCLIESLLPADVLWLSRRRYSRRLCLR